MNNRNLSLKMKIKKMEDEEADSFGDTFPDLRSSKIYLTTEVHEKKKT